MSKKKNTKNESAENKVADNVKENIEEAAAEEKAENKPEAAAEEKAEDKPEAAAGDDEAADDENDSEKGSKILWPIIIIALFMALIVTVIILSVKLNRRNSELSNVYGKTQLGNALADAEEEVAVEDMTEESVTAEEPQLPKKEAVNTAKNNCLISFNADGYTFYVPNEYECRYRTNTGIMIYMTDIFQMKVMAKGRPYDELVKNKQELIDTAEQAGGSECSKVSSMTVNGNEYTYFRFMYKDEPNIVIYGSTPDGKSHTGGQIIIFKDTLTDAELVKIFDSVVSGMEYTGKADTTEEELSELNASVSIPIKSKSTIEYEDMSFTYHIPDDLYYSDTFTYEGYVTETYWNDNTLATVSIQGHEVYDNAKELLAEKISVSENEIQLSEEKIDGRVVYYYIEDVDSSSGGSDQRILAAIDVDRTTIYMVDYDVYSVTDRVTFDDISDFFVSSEGDE